MKNRRLIALAVLTLSSVSACAEPQETRTSICELVKYGEKMNGQRVRLRAIYLTDLLELSSLNDPHCPKQAVAPDWKSSRDPSLDAFDRVLFGRPPDYREMTQFSIDVSGKFVWNANGKPHGALMFEKIWSFKRLHGDWKKVR